jgi:hypothetical protein
MSVAQLQNSFVNNITFETLSSPKYDVGYVPLSNASITINNSNIQKTLLGGFSTFEGGAGIRNLTFYGIYTPVNAGAYIGFTIEDAPSQGNVLALTSTYAGTRWGAVGSNLYTVPIPFSITATSDDDNISFYVFANTPSIFGGGVMATLTNMNYTLFTPKNT